VTYNAQLTNRQTKEIKTTMISKRLKLSFGFILLGIVIIFCAQQFIESPEFSFSPTEAFAGSREVDRPYGWSLQLPLTTSFAALSDSADQSGNAVPKGWTNVTIRSDVDIEIIHTHGAYDTTGNFSGRPTFVVPANTTISFGADTPIRDIWAKTVSGTGTLYVIGSRKYAQP
jgi:hypothetical protein